MKKIVSIILLLIICVSTGQAKGGVDVGVGNEYHSASIDIPLREGNTTFFIHSAGNATHVIVDEIGNLTLPGHSQTKLLGKNFDIIGLGYHFNYITPFVGLGLYTENYEISRVVTREGERVLEKVTTDNVTKGVSFGAKLEQGVGKVGLAVLIARVPTSELHLVGSFKYNFSIWNLHVGYIAKSSVGSSGFVGVGLNF